MMGIDRWVYALPLRLRSLFTSSRVEDDLNDELQDHLERQTAAFVADGLSPEEARLAARRAMGGLEQRKEECRDARRVRLIEDLGRDLRYAVRTLRRNPGFAAVVVLSLALGIGANTAMFSAIDVVMLRLVPVRDPGQLVMLTSEPSPQAFVDSTEGTRGEVFSSATYEEIRDHNDVFAGTLAFAANTPSANVGVRRRAESAAVKGVSGTYFDALGIAPLYGRMIQPGDDRDGAAPVAVVSHRYWAGSLGQDPAAVGTSVVINGEPVTIVGVVPPGFFGLDPMTSIDLYLPLHLYAAQMLAGGNAGTVAFTHDPRTWWLHIVGRLKPGVSETEARLRLGVLFDRSLRASGGTQVQSVPTPRLATRPIARGLDRLRRQFATPLVLLTGMVAVVLLIACANVAGLLFARASARQREIAIRLSLGAGPFRLIRQLLTESILLAMLGGAAGLVCASWIDAALVALLTAAPQAPRLTLGLDGRVLAFTAAISILTGLVCGVAPAFRATRLDVRPIVKLTSRKLLVGLQVAACLLLLTCAGLLLRTLQNLEAVDLGFDRQQLVLFTVRPGMNGYKDARLTGYYDELQRRLGGVPGVQSVTLSLRPPVGGGSGSSGTTIPGITAPGERASVFRHQIGAGYFETLGIPIVAGRAIGPPDVRSAPRVAVVNRALVRRYFHGGDPIGHRIDFGSAARPNAFEVVGVAEDAKYNQLRGDVPPVAYLPYQQFLALPNFMTYHVRGGGDLSSLVAAIEREVRALDANVPVVGMKTQTEAIGQMLVLERTLAALSTFFGLLALALACVGLYGTMAYAVAQRTREIGVRMALGAGGHAIQGLILRETLTIVVVGLVVGVPLALTAARLLQAQLFGLSPHDPATVFTATAAVLAVTLLAGYIPARRASQVDAMVALRCE